MAYKSKTKHKRGGLVNSATPVYAYNPKEYSVGGIFGEVAAGAGMGALAGGMAGGITALPGALIGGGVGLVKGLLGHRQENLANLEKERAAEALANQEQMANQGQIIPPLQSTRTFQSSTNIPTFALGGAMGMPRPPEEKQEKAVDKMLVDLDGPLHEDGGIALAGNEVEGGETMFRFKGQGGKVEKFVFSNLLKVPDTEDTFAQVSKRINNQFSKRPDSDRISNRSKERELRNLMAQQIPLTLAAEEKAIMKNGGSLRSKSMAPTYDTQNNMYLNRRSRSPMRRGGNMYGLGTPVALPTAMSNFFNPSLLSQGSGGGGAGGQGFFSGFGSGMGGLGASLLESLPGLLGAAGPLAQLRMANQPAEQVRFERAPLPGAPQFVDPSQTIKGIKETFGGVRQGIRETATRPGQSITGQIVAGSKEAGAIGDVQGRFANINAQIANRRQELKQQTLAGNSMIGNQELMTNMASRGVRDSSRIDAISALGNIGGQFSRDVREQQAQKRQNQLMQALLSNAFENLNYSNGQYTLKP